MSTPAPTVAAGPGPGPGFGAGPGPGPAPMIPNPANLAIENLRKNAEDLLGELNRRVGYVPKNKETALEQLTNLSRIMTTMDCGIGRALLQAGFSPRSEELKALHDAINAMIKLDNKQDGQDGDEKATVAKNVPSKKPFGA